MCIEYAGKALKMLWQNLSLLKRESIFWSPYDNHRDMCAATLLESIHSVHSVHSVHGGLSDQAKGQNGKYHQGTKHDPWSSLSQLK